MKNKKRSAKKSKQAPVKKQIEPAQPAEAQNKQPEAMSENTAIDKPLEFDIPKIENPVSTSQPVLQTQDSQSMLADLMSETDKDNQEENPNDTDSDFNFEHEENSGNETSEHVSETQAEKNITDKLHETITSEGEDWENIHDFRKMCSINAMMYVEGGAIFLSFIGQLISGDWSKEGETKYMPSEERRKLIRNPLAKKFELNRNRKKSSPMGAMITAIIFTVLPIIIVAFKDRKSKIDREIKEIENNKLKEELEKANAVIAGLRVNAEPSNTHGTNMNNSHDEKIASSYLDKRLEKRGRHKKDCDCDKCNLKRMKTKKKGVKV